MAGGCVCDCVQAGSEGVLLVCRQALVDSLGQKSDWPALLAELINIGGSQVGRQLVRYNQVV